jgi:hypothetical protein
VVVNHGPALQNGGVTNHHTQPVRVEGQRVEPLPVLEHPVGRLSYQGAGTHTMPVGRSYGFTGNGGSSVRPVPPNATSGSQQPVAGTPRPGSRPATPVQGGRPVMPAPQRATPPVQGVRPVVPAPQRITPPAYTPPPARTYSPPPAPRNYSPPPAPRVSAPPASAPHPSAGPGGRR